jgi:hypothetical protein
MKKLSLIIIVLLSVSAGVYGQNIDDALRYSQIFYGGTARFMSMGGAFTALGGDISSLSQNPAGLGVFRSSEFTITPQLFQIKTTARFNGSSYSDQLYNFNLNQIGIVSNLIANDKESGLITLNVGYSFNKTNNLHQSVIIQGINNASSMADYWAGISNGTFYKDLTGPQGIAYDAWILDTITGSGQNHYGTVYNNYGDNTAVYGQTVRRLITNDGYTGEHAISIGGNYSNKIFFGATLGISTLRYTSSYEHLESTDISLPSAFKNFTYTDYFEDNGTGYSLKFGAIIKPIEAIRIGLAFHSPTWYRINEYFYNNITSNFTDGAKYESANDPLRFSYSLATPFRALAGIAVQIEKIALVSADYEFVDYSTASFSASGVDYSKENAAIKSSLKSTSNIRLGGELRLNKLYLRGGYGFYGKPFQSTEDNANLDYRSLSAGIGFREQRVSIDFAFTNYKYSQKYFLYSLDSSYPTTGADLNTMKNMFTLTLGYKFGY